MPVSDMTGVTGNNLKELRRRAGITQAVVAEEMEVSVPQVSRWETGADGIPSSRLPSLALAYRASIGEIFGEPEPFQPVGPTLYVKGKVAAGWWRPAFELPPEEWRTFTGRSDVNARLSDRFGLEVVGESMNLLYPQGTIVECVKLLGGAELSSGKRVAVVRERDDFEIEATVKEYLVDADGVEWLWPRSNHPEFQQPWRVDRPERGITRVEIIGVVVASIRPE